MAYEFSQTSMGRLNTCDERLKRIALEILKVQDCTVLEGHRSVDRQNELFRQGVSKVPGGKSYHNASPSQAMDIAPYPIEWDDRDRFLLFVGRIRGIADMLGIPVRVGADWDGDGYTNDQKFHDMPHVELRLA